MKKTTIHDIADELDVTASTVSRALKNHPRISDSTKRLVVEMADKLNYHPNNIASALRNGKSNIVGVVIPTSDRSFFASVVKGIEQVLSKKGYNCIISQSDDLLKKEQANIDALLKVQVDGIIASVAKETSDFRHYQKAIDRGVPVVLFDRVNENLEVNTVVNDDYYGADKAVNHLIKQGCTKIAHFAGNTRLNIYKERLRGYRNSLNNHNLPINEKWILEDDLINESKKVVEIGRKLSRQLLELDEVPDAIFSSSDFAAMGAIQELKAQGIRIPQDIALVGFSNDLSTNFISPSLTSVDQHTLQMGNFAAELFLEQVNADEGATLTAHKRVLKPELIIRESSKLN